MGLRQLRQVPQRLAQLCHRIRQIAAQSNVGRLPRCRHAELAGLRRRRGPRRAPSRRGGVEPPRSSAICSRSWSDTSCNRVHQSAVSWTRVPAARAAAADHRPRENADAPEPAMRAGLADAPSGGCRANISRTPSAKRRGMAMCDCASRMAWSQASRMAPVSCHWSGGMASMMPATGPYSSRAKRKGRRDRFVGGHPFIGVAQSLHQELLDQIARMGRRVGVHCGQQCCEQAAPPPAPRRCGRHARPGTASRFHRTTERAARHPADRRAKRSVLLSPDAA